MFLSGVRCDGPPTPPTAKSLAYDDYDGVSMVNVDDSLDVVCDNDSKILYWCQVLSH